MLLLIVRTVADAHGPRAEVAGEVVEGRLGEVGRARALFEKLLSFAGPLLLYAEEIDTGTGQHLGNFPQAFTHLALIDAAQRLIEAERAADATATP